MIAKSGGKLGVQTGGEVMVLAVYQYFSYTIV